MEWQEELQPGEALREIVQQATAALISMDAKRLEELARCCADLNREIETTERAAETAVSLRHVANDVKLLGRVLYETRANLTVLSRLHVIRMREAGVWGHSVSKTERNSEYGDN
jgi:hypothetical protein